MIIDNALNLWFGCLQHQPELFDEFVANETIGDTTPEKFLISGLLYCKIDSIREQFKAVIGNLCKANKDNKRMEFVFKLLSDLLPQMSGHPCK